VVNVPLNDDIKAAGDPDRIADLGAVRDAFHETRWVAWNVVRTILNTVAFGCLLWALVLHGRATGGADRAGAVDDARAAAAAPPPRERSVSAAGASPASWGSSLPPPPPLRPRPERPPPHVGGGLPVDRTRYCADPADAGEVP
jgi:hypothetical protein